MRLRVLVAAALGLWIAMIAESRAATSRDSTTRLIQAAYFSDDCRKEAGSLGITQSSDANALFAAFARSRRDVGVASMPAAHGNDCTRAAILLLNLLRANGLDAQLAFAYPESTSAAEDGTSSGRAARILVYVPLVDRYFDPAESPGRQAVLHRIIVEKSRRVHIVGPSLTGGSRAHW